MVGTRCVLDVWEEPGDGLLDELLAAHARGGLTWCEVLETTVLLYMPGGPNPACLIAAGPPLAGPLASSGESR